MILNSSRLHSPIHHRKQDPEVGHYPHKQVIKLDSNADLIKGRSSSDDILDPKPIETSEEEVVEFKNSKKHGPHIGNMDEAPDWLIDNHFILTGYRINFTTPKLTLKSLFICHNESTNIWSHLSGVILFF